MITQADAAIRSVIPTSVIVKKTFPTTSHHCPRERNLLDLVSGTVRDQDEVAVPDHLGLLGAIVPQLVGFIAPRAR
jgi:hypothetical protein